MPPTLYPVDGLVVGTVVEVHDLPAAEAPQDINGKLALIVDYAPSSRKFSIVTVQGVTAEASSQYLRIPPDLGRPGLGGKEDSFDIIVGPRLNLPTLGEAISRCLMEKGFCVLKKCQSGQATARAVDAMRDLAAEAKLLRLPEEVESGYLGTGAKGKVVWLEDSDPHAPKEATIRSSDDFLSKLAYSLLPHSMNLFGVVAEARTPALLSLSMLPGEEAEFPQPFADDVTLTTYFKTWRRSVLRAVHFMGPGTSSVTLTKKDDSLPLQEVAVTISASPNTIVLYRPACFDYGCENPDEDSLSMMVQYMEPEVKLTTGLVGKLDPDLIAEFGAGCAGPAGECVNVMNEATRLAAGWDDADMYKAGTSGGCDVGVEMPFARFDYTYYYAADPTMMAPWQMTTKHMGYVEGIEYFDHKYFNIPLNEAKGMDPMQRQVLETGAMNLLKMGITKKIADRNPSHAGFAVGLDKDDFDSIQKCDDVLNNPGQNVQAIIANRFSFIFNLKGGSFVGDTACSSSLTVAHLGKVMLQDRRFDKLDFFLAMGLHQCLSFGPFIGNSQSHMSSIVGRCQTFNATADGYMRGDGCSGMILKYGDLPKERECVWRASQVGQNGRSATLTAPNGLSQEAVIWNAIREADSEPQDSVVWSCHGTGTSLGDPIEVGGIRKVQMKGDRESPLLVNTNKTNTGHLEGGAAMTSLISAVFQVKQMKANPLNHFAQLNPHLEASQFMGVFQSELGSTETYQGNVNVSSFGFGGTNVHAILWGHNKYELPAMTHLWRKKLSKLNPPGVRPSGADPADWDHDFHAKDIKPGDVYHIRLPKDSDKSVRYELQEEGLGEEHDEDDLHYSIVGNFNDWSPERMEVGDVPGLSTAMVEVPESGQVEFRFVQTVAEEMVIAPPYPHCTKKTAMPQGPAEGLTNCWVAKGTPGSFMRIDLFSAIGRIGVLWMPAA